MKQATPRLEEMTRVELQEYLRQAVRPEDGHIPAFLFNNPVIHKLESEQLFLRTWLFLAHESEIATPGEFVTRDLGGHSVIVSRGDDNKIRVFLNMCRHRGMRLCRADHGQQSHFTCPYHGFTYSSRGQLTGVPFQRDAFGPEFDRSKMSLHEARVAVYQGLIFGTWNEDAPSLKTFLGDMTWYLDLLVGRADMEVMGPPQRWVVNSTWKLAADNFVHDSYHTMYTHASIAKLGMVPSSDYSKYGYQIDCGGGHGLNLGTPASSFSFPDALRPEYQRRLNSAQYDVLTKMKNMIGTVFPNLSFLISSTDFKGQLVSNTTLRLWAPKGPDKIEIYAWILVEKDASDEWKQLSRQSSVFTFSPSGIFEQDDTENFVDITSNAKGVLPIVKDISFSYLSGMQTTPVTDFVGPGQAYDGKFSEHNARSFYRAWLDALLDSSGWR